MAARVKRVAKCRKAQGKCGKCGCEIKVGDPYIRWAFRFGGRYVRCAKPECYPKPHELINSPFQSELAAIQETVFDGEDMDTLSSQRDDVVGELENLRDEVQGNLENMPEGLQQGSTGEMMQERINALEEAINELEGLDFDEEEKEENETDKEYAARKEELLNEARTNLESALSNISCE